MTRGLQANKRAKPGYVYIVTNKRNGTLYIGATSNLAKRIYEHRNGLIEGFTKRYGCKYLVWYDAHDDLDEARLAERRMKKWNRPWKLRVIEERNPGWTDLYSGLF